MVETKKRATGYPSSLSSVSLNTITQPTSVLSQSLFQGNGRQTSIISASQGITRPNSIPSHSSSLSLTPSQSASQPEVGRWKNVANGATTILHPFEMGANIFSAFSNVGANIFNMYQTSILTQASIKAQEAQSRANTLFSNLNQLNLDEKKAGIRIEVHRLQTTIDRLKKEAKELEDLNTNAPELQKRYNDHFFEQKTEEIRLKEEELNIYNGILTSNNLNG